MSSRVLSSSRSQCRLVKPILNYRCASTRNTTPEARRPRRILSGIQPTGIPHLGNYLGALSNWVKLQRDALPEDELIYTVVGWHALTLPQKPKELFKSRQDMMAVLLAVGLDPKRSIIFHQDHNPSHTELAWIFNCMTSLGQLRRMTTWKSKLATARNTKNESDIDESLLNAGLLTYPVLQAADILIYRATHVPVGDDQTQHIELCRDLADLFNRRFKGKGSMFSLPQIIKTQTKRILSLRDPSAKMSKSAPDLNSRILLTDTAPQIQAKIRSSVTDGLGELTYDPEARPGTANLLTILGAITGQEDLHALAATYSGKGHAELKTDTADAIEELLRGPRAEFERLRVETAYLNEVAEDGARRSKEKTDVTMKEVKARIGLA
ncbi:hypothetical protein BD626DRAFT_17042 [Schizophyllum amplum]|uniref:tryptophan--tRNA ligase n=1 Tax=Schizophyllum amplum TaxID=97359 RepID=A0A550CY42_9AGAR|nr:hypothetical protein BD626DRAFT_17042 [Auriculariopsis ampla]